MNHYNDLSVFVMDSDPVCGALYKQYLANMGILNIEIFEDAQQFMSFLGRLPNIVLLTHQTVPIDGLEMLRNIKRFDSDIYVIYVLKQKDMRLVVDALKCGAFNCIVKGFNEEELLTSMVKNVVSLMQLSKKGPTKSNSINKRDKQ